MSQLQTDINLPSINSIDGFVTDGSMTTVMYSVENELDSIGNAVGNIHGTGDFQYDERKLINSLASSVGSELEDPALPYGIDLNNVVETHTLSGAKETALGLIIDTESSVTIEGFDNLNVSSGMYTVSTDPYNMSDTECFIDGRLIFFKKPPYSFTIQYTGTYPTSPFLNKNGYLPNVIPNPKSEGFVRPNLSLSSGRVAVDIVTANAVKTTNTYQDQYDIGFADYILPFVDGSGVTPCPKAYISAYKLNTISGKYDKLQVDNIYIISNTRFELDTDAEIDLDNDTIIISIANMSIKEWLIVAMRELQNHKHDGSDISSPLNHSDLAGLVPRSLNENINYAKSQIPNNDHPQYLNREGYSEDDNGTYRNAMLGDLFIASVNPDNLFNNIIERSNQIVFGATGGSGHSLYREAQADGDVLTVASQSNGIRISYEYNNQKYAIAIQTDGGNHEIGNRIDTNDLLVHSKTGNTVFGKYNSGLATYELESIEVENVKANSISIGPITIDKQANNIEITSTGPTSSINISTIVGIRDNSISKGVVFSDGVNTYAKIYDCAEDGTTSTAIDNHLVIASGSDVYLTKNTTTSTTGVSTDERATLYAGDTHFYTVGANKTAGIKKNGIQFGLDHSIYLTEEAVLNANTLVLEANNKVIFTKPSLVVNVDTPTYTDLQANDIYAKDVVISGRLIGDVEANSTITANLDVTNSLVCTNASTATFNGEVFFNESIVFNDDVSINVLNVQTIGAFSGALSANNASVQNLIGEVSTNLKGQIILSPHITNPSSLTCNIPATFNQECIFTAAPVFATGVTLNSATINTLISTNFTTNFANIENATIESLTITSVLNAAGVNTDVFDTDNDGIVVSGRIQQIGVTEDNIFQAQTNFGRGISLAAVGQTIDVNNGYIENLEMKTVPDDKDAANVKFVKDQIAAALLSSLLSATYPVGTVYTNATNPNNPGFSSGPFGANYFGTWDEYAEGRVIVGSGSTLDTRNETIFFSTGATGGEFKHELTVSEMPSHSLQYYSYLTQSYAGDSGNGGGGAITSQGNRTTSSIGDNTAHNNMQPYIVAKIWVRTA